MATRGITTIDAANAFLLEFIARYNETFAREARDKESAWMPLKPNMDLDYHFSAMDIRTVKSDHTIVFLNQTLQLVPDKRGPSLAGRQVEVHQLPDGALLVYYNKARIAYKKLAAPPVKVAAERKPKRVAPLDPEAKRTSRRRQMAHLHTSTR